MKVIFLDIDGVMNSASGKEPYYIYSNSQKQLDMLILYLKNNGLNYSTDKEIQNGIIKTVYWKID